LTHCCAGPERPSGANMHTRTGFVHAVVRAFRFGAACTPANKSLCKFTVLESLIAWHGPC